MHTPESKNNTHALLVENLTKSYKKKIVIDKLNFHANEGEILAILGPNGAGKTTTLACIQGLEKITSGNVALLNLDPSKYNPQLKTQVGVVLQDGGLPQNIKPLNFLNYLAKFYPNAQKNSALINKLEIKKFKNTTIRRLSGGEKQKVSLAAALLANPKILFLDEPSAGLDPQTKHIVWEIISQLRKQKVTIILTTHLMEEAEILADKVCIMNHGKIIAQGCPTEIIQKITGKKMITFSGPNNLPIHNLQKLLQKHLVKEKTPGKYQITGEIDLLSLKKTAHWCESNHPKVNDLGMKTHNLEDVFLQLTGKTFL